MNHLSGTSLHKNGIRIFGPKRAWNILLKPGAAQDPEIQIVCGSGEMFSQISFISQRC